MEFTPEFIPEFIPESTHELLDFLEMLLQYATIPEERKQMLYRQVYSMNYDECVSLAEELSGKQIERISGGLNYNMTYLNKFLKRTI